MADDAVPVCHLFMPALADAVKRTASALGIPHGVAAARIVDAARAGLIDGYWRGKYTNQLYRRDAGQLILRSEWAGADIDWRADVLILASGERRALVVLDRKQFEAWLAAELKLLQGAVTVTQTADKKTRGRRWKRNLAGKAVKARFPTGVLPTTAEVIRLAREWLVENHPDDANKISDDTIRAAAGLK